MQEVWTIRKLISWTVPWFDERGIASSRLDAELLLAKALHCQRMDLYLNPDKPVNETERSSYKTLIKRRAAREPVAYILGVKEFWNRSFRVDHRVLIPRPETELVIDTALAHVDRGNSLLIADLGTGSGCIAVTLAAECVDSRVIATDESVDAIDVAHLNANALKVDDRIMFCRGSWFSALRDVAEPGSFDLIVSNPPYIAHDALNGLQPEIRSYEPVIALDGGSEGLEAYVEISREAKQWLKTNGCLILEIGHMQGQRVREFLSEASFDSIEIINDMAGRERVVVAKRIP